MGKNILTFGEFSINEANNINISDAKDLLRDEYFNNDANVTGVGISADEYGEFIVIYLLDNIGEYPNEFNGFRVKTIVTGTISQQSISEKKMDI